MAKILPRKGVLNITPYKAGDAKIEGFDTVIKLASNESPMGPSPAAIDAVKTAADSGMQLYPDPACTALRAAIGDVHNIDPDQIICSNGSEELLHLLAKGYATDGDEIIFCQYGFLAYPIATHAVGATPVVVPEDNFTANVDAILAAQTGKTKIVNLANPNNPTGTYLSKSEILRLRAGLRNDILLVLDAAYAEYVDQDDYDAGFDLVNNGLENTIVTRTFSKIYGLAAARVGWAYGPKSVLDILHRIRGAFNVTALSQAAATAAVRDQDHVAKAKAHNLKWVPKLSQALSEWNMTVTPSQGNFLLAHFPGGPDQSVAADQFLRSRGIIVRPVANYGMPQALRITIGTDVENEALLAAFTEFFAA
ncbi:histidinol-phosphate transaminase [Paremcibacter congregatus]|uniref:histidinol-phosphate transaminase n=1 Tax=Paremcibacter congregatus TaxID=2043170 RepID=UPI003A934EA4